MICAPSPAVTGVARLTINKNKFGLFESVEVDGAKVVTGGEVKAQTVEVTGRKIDSAPSNQLLLAGVNL